MFTYEKTFTNPMAYMAVLPIDFPFCEWESRVPPVRRLDRLAGTSSCNDFLQVL